MINILFISHEASRSGAPIVLLKLLKWIKKNTTIHFDVLLIEGGELESEFKTLGEVLKPIYEKETIFKRITRKILKRIKIHQEKSPIEKLLIKYQTKNYSIIYGNTIVSISIFDLLYQFFPKAKFFLHVHELYSVTRKYSNTIGKLSDIPVIFISVSDLVTKNLKNNHNVKSQVHLIYSFIDFEFLNFYYNSKSKPSELKFIVDGGGLVRVTKGYDIFILVAKRAIQKNPSIPYEFRWFGEIPENLQYYINIDINLGGLSDKLKFYGKLGDPYSKFAESDVMLLTSREDSFPTICLEHAALGIPTICFENVTGITEFVQTDAGIIVPYLDIEKIVDTLAELYHNMEKRKLLGLTARERVNQFDISLQVPKIIDLINNA